MDGPYCQSQSYTGDLSIVDRDDLDFLQGSSDLKVEDDTQARDMPEQNIVNDGAILGTRETEELEDSKAKLRLSPIINGPELEDGTADNPITLDDSEPDASAARQVAVNGSSPVTSRASNHSQVPFQATDHGIEEEAVSIAPFDGPNSPRRSQTSRKRPSSHDGGVSPKRARGVFLEDILGPQQTVIVPEFGERTRGSGISRPVPFNGSSSFDPGCNEGSDSEFEAPVPVAPRAVQQCEDDTGYSGDNEESLLSGEDDTEDDRNLEFQAVQKPWPKRYIRAVRQAHNQQDELPNLVQDEQEFRDDQANSHQEPVQGLQLWLEDQAHWDEDMQPAHQKDQDDADADARRIRARSVAIVRRMNKGKEKAPFVSLGDRRYKATRSKDAMARYRRRVREGWVSSAKLDKILDIIESIREHDPTEKVLVFSLWTSFLDMLEVALENARPRFKYTRYDGGIAAHHRDAAISKFEKDPDLNIMLISLTAGSVGLNLVMASQVIICEPFWNPYTEEQAIDRAHRLGQQREVTVHRVLIRGTVEDRILALQTKKRALVNAALSEEGASAASRLSLAEIKDLFG